MLGGGGGGGETFVYSGGGGEGGERLLYTVVAQVIYHGGPDHGDFVLTFSLAGKGMIIKPSAENSSLLTGVAAFKLRMFITSLR